MLEAQSNARRPAGKLRILLALSAAVLTITVGLPAIAATDSTGRGQLLDGARKLDARASYKAYCASCHGPTGDGRDDEGNILVKVDFTAPAAAADLDHQAILDAIGQGHDANTRAAWIGKLDGADAEQIVRYIREAFMLPTPAADASIGQQIYARTCSVCHGERGNSASWAQNSLNPPPRDFTSEKARTLTRRQMINAVTYGKEDTAMMPFTTQYSAEEIAAVVDYIRGTFMKGAPASAETTAPAHGHTGMALSEQQANLAPTDSHAAHGHTGADGDMTASFPSGLVGDTAKGKDFYDNNCAECHGLKGDGDGPRAYFINPKPRDFTSPKARVEFNRPHLFSAISMGVPGREMAAWSKVLDDQQIANVAEYVFEAFIRADAGLADGAQDGAHTGTTHGHENDGHDHATEEAVKKN